ALCALLLLFAAPVLAQEDEAERFSIGIGGGIVQTDTGNQPYLTAALRIRAGYRNAGEEGRGSVTGFVEPEVGYWTGTAAGVDEKDTLLGINVGGAVRLRSVEYFLGGGVGYHFIKRDLGALGSRNDNKVGANAQFGFDLLMTDTISIYGVGRFDLVQDAP